MTFHDQRLKFFDDGSEFTCREFDDKMLHKKLVCRRNGVDGSFRSFISRMLVPEMVHVDDCNTDCTEYRHSKRDSKVISLGISGKAFSLLFMTILSSYSSNCFDLSLLPLPFDAIIFSRSTMSSLFLLD